MAFNFRSSGSKQVFLDDSQLSNHRYYRFPDETGTFVTSVSTGSFPFTAGRIAHGFTSRPDLCAKDCNTNPKDFFG